MIRYKNQCIVSPEDIKYGEYKNDYGGTVRKRMKQRQK